MCRKCILSRTSYLILYDSSDNSSCSYFKFFSIRKSTIYCNFCTILKCCRSSKYLWFLGSFIIDLKGILCNILISNYYRRSWRWLRYCRRLSRSRSDVWSSTSSTSPSRDNRSSYYNCSSRRSRIPSNIDILIYKWVCSSYSYIDWSRACSSNCTCSIDIIWPSCTWVRPIRILRNIYSSRTYKSDGWRNSISRHYIYCTCYGCTCALWVCIGIFESICTNSIYIDWTRCCS